MNDIRKILMLDHVQENADTWVDDRKLQMYKWKGTFLIVNGAVMEYWIKQLNLDFRLLLG